MSDSSTEGGGWAKREHQPLAGHSGGDATAMTTRQFYDPQTVVSLDVSGQPLSVYADRCWDFSAMGSDGGQTQKNLHFFEASPTSEALGGKSLGLASQIREEQKALLWLHIDTGRQLALKTIYQANLALTALARGAYQRGISLFALYLDPTALGEEVAGMNSSYSKSARALLRTIWRNQAFLGIGVELRLKELVEVIRRSAREEQAEGQTPIIPSRIYCAILANLVSGLDDIERELPTLLEAYCEERILRLKLPSRTNRGNRNIRLSALKDVLRERGWQNGNTQWFISGAMSGILARLMNVVVAFTGMRIGEARILPLNGTLETVEVRGIVHHVVHGFSHKLNGGKRAPASWVTNDVGARAIKIAQRIAATILDAVRGAESDERATALLFPSTINPYKKQGTSTTYSRMLVFIPDLCPVVTQQDVDELNAMELERNWLRSGIVVGQPWPLAFHQYRRSLSVYAHRSGMVSLPALKRQLQHITDEMRAYYSDGFCRAVNLVFDKDHFSHEWRIAKAESSFLAYSLALLFSDDDLVGEIGGQGAQRMQAVVSKRSRPETLKLFRDGKLAYRETVLGGCTATDGCDQSPLEPIPWDCLEKDCIHSVVFSKRLEHLTRTQEAVVAALSQREPGSVEHRLEADHLAVLVKALVRHEAVQ